MTARSFGDARQFGDVINRILPNKNPDRPKKPHRWSYDVNDRRAQVFKPVGNGTRDDKRLHMGAMLRTFDETLLRQRKTKYSGPHRLQDSYRRVLLYMLDRQDAATGQLDPEFKTIAREAGVSISTVGRALMCLAHHIGLRWVRRTRAADTEGERGPQQVQTSDAYWFDVATMPSRVFNIFQKWLRGLADNWGRSAPDVATRRVRPKHWRRDDCPIWSPIVRNRQESAERRVKRRREQEAAQAAALAAQQDDLLKQVLNSISQGPFVEDSVMFKNGIYPEGKLK